MRRSISPATLAAAGIMQTPDISAVIWSSVLGGGLPLTSFQCLQFIFYLFAIYFLFVCNLFSILN